MGYPLRLQLATIGQLGQHFSPRQTGLFVGAHEGIAVGDEVALEIGVGVPVREQMRLSGRVTETGCEVSFGTLEDQVVRVAVEGDSWEQVFNCVCRTPWRRSHDYALTSAEGRRWSLLEDATCYAPDQGKRWQATITEVSETGAFLAMDGELSPGDMVRFAGRHAMSWHAAEVRWVGVKNGMYGVGVALDFTSAEDRSRWISWLGLAERRSSSSGVV